VGSVACLVRSVSSAAHEAPDWSYILSCKALIYSCVASPSALRCIQSFRDVKEHRVDRVLELI